MAWFSLADRGARVVEALAWNHIIHSWVDPLALAAIIAAGWWVAYRVVRWMFEK